MLCLRKELSGHTLNINEDGTIWMFESNFKNHCIYTAKVKPEIVKVFIQHENLLVVDTSGKLPFINFGGLKIQLNSFEVDVDAAPLEYEPQTTLDRIDTVEKKVDTVEQKLEEIGKKLDKIMIGVAPKYDVMLSAEISYVKNVVNYKIYQWETPVTFNRMVISGSGVEYSDKPRGSGVVTRMTTYDIRPSFEISLETGYHPKRIWHLPEPITCYYLNTTGTVHSAWLE